MEAIGEDFFNGTFLDNWYRHYNELKAYLDQNRNIEVSPAGEMEKDMVKWIGIQSRIKYKLPLELRNKLAALNLNSEDILWECMYQQLASFANKNGHTHLPANEEYELLNDWFLRQIQGKQYLPKGRFSRLNLLGVDWYLIITRDQRWEQMYLNLKEFYQTFGHSRVPQKWEPDNSLTNWVRVQRRMHKLNKLQPERERKLNELNFIWHIQVVYDAQWQHYYQELQQFYQTNGHCQVPGKNKPLTSWIENQRTARKNQVLPSDREQQLNQINFIWSFKDLKKSRWQERYVQLGDFKQKHGHCLVPVIYKENRSLGFWVATQRRLEERGKLKESKKEQLSQLGFVWSTHTQRQLKSIYQSQWVNNFEKLKRYQQTYGSCQVSLQIDPALQRWTRWQRMLFYQGKLSDNRMSKLNEIQFPWNIQESYWMKMYEALTQFQKQFGHTRVPFQWEPNRQLADWVYRLKLTKAELSRQKLELLNMISFDWHLNRRTVVSWEDMYSRLVKFKQEYGHTRVPVSWLPDPKLGKWVSRMRQVKDKLPAEREVLLHKIAFDWDRQYSSVAIHSLVVDQK